MAGRKRVKPEIKVASARQLWTANRHGLLTLRSEPDAEHPLTVSDLWEPVGRAKQEWAAGEVDSVLTGASRAA